MERTQPLIAGAGPVGLAAALFVARDGVVPRIIDSAPEPSPYSKALAVNPRTLEILEPSGITAQMLAIGKPIGCNFSLWQITRRAVNPSTFPRDRCIAGSGSLPSVRRGGFASGRC
jgi:2-polyprenyl-6-methoxyphenol hydroxylase-like FAD-dependent oxidoreductase